MEIGAQFFTVREFTKTPEALAETLKKVADIGYRHVQISGTCKYDPAWLKGELDKNGLVCDVTHIDRERLIGETAQVVEDHKILDCPNIGIGYYGWDDRADHNVENFWNNYLRVAKDIKAGGKYFMYHNHDQEFKKLDGKVIMEHLMERFAPDEMGFIMDTYWVQVGGGDPARWLEKLAGRIPVIHLKDCGYAKRMEVIGEGNINFDRVFEKAEAGGTKVMFVEQDDCNGENPFDCLRRSYENLRAYGFR